MKRNLLVEIWARLKLPTPPFWKKIRSRCLAAALALTGFLTQYSSIAGVTPLPATITTPLGYLCAALYAVAAIASCAIDDNASETPTL